MSVEVSRIHLAITTDSTSAVAGLKQVSAATAMLPTAARGAAIAADGLFSVLKGGANLALAPVRALTGGVFDLIGSVGKQAAAFALGTLAAEGLKRAMDGLSSVVVGFNAKLETSTMKWQTFLGGSREDADAMLWHMQKLAALTPFNYEGVEKGYTLLKAYGFALQELDPWLKRIGNASAMVGAGAQGIERLSLSLGQIRAMGKLQGAEARELSLMGIPVWEMLGKSLGKSPGQVRAMSEAGEISAQVFLDAFAEYVDSKGDMMGSLNKTLTGAWSTVKDTFNLLGSTAFKPLFDVISRATQTLASWLQTDDAMKWAAKVNAGVSLVITGIETLLPIVTNVASGLLSVLWEMASSAYEALSYLNPFARHSPSLVEQVNSGVQAIIDKYDTLKDFASPFKAGTDEFKAALNDQKAGVDRLKNALDGAKASLNLWKETPIAGEGAAADKQFALQQQIKRAQLELVEVEGQRGSRRQAASIQKRIDELQRQAEKLRLQTEIKYDPMHRQIDKESSDKPAERSKNEIIQGIRDTKREVLLLTPVYEANAGALKKMEQAAKDAAAAAALVGGGGITKPADDTGFLKGDKDALARFNAMIADYKTGLQGITEGFDKAREAIQRFDAVVQTAKQGGLAAGISQLFYPTAYGLTPAESERNARLKATGPMAGESGPSQQHFLEPPKYTEWGPLLDQMWTDFQKAFGDSWEKAKPKVVETASDVGKSIGAGIFGNIWNADLSWSDIVGLSDENAAKAEAEINASWGEKLGDALVAVLIPTGDTLAKSLGKSLGEMTIGSEKPLEYAGKTMGQHFTDAFLGAIKLGIQRKWDAEIVQPLGKLGDGIKGVFDWHRAERQAEAERNFPTPTGTPVSSSYDNRRRAGGGWVQAGQTYLVGEEGPEPFTPGSSGYVHPNSTLGGGIVVHAPITVQAGPEGISPSGIVQIERVVHRILDEAAAGVIAGRKLMPIGG